MWKIGNGNRAGFSEDTWIIEVPLKVRLPKLYAISEGKEKIIAKLGRWGDVERLCWRIYYQICLLLLAAQFYSTKSKGLFYILEYKGVPAI